MFLAPIHYTFSENVKSIVFIELRFLVKLTQFLKVWKQLSFFVT